jgi:ABC-2 type transport system permease protein
MPSYVRFEVTRTLRNPRFLVMTMFMPVMLNVVFVQLNGSRLAPHALASFASGYMTNMAAFATVSACLSTAGNRLAQERADGWFTYLTLTPLRPIDIIAGKVVSAIALGVPAVLGVFASGVVVNGVPFQPGRLLLALALVVVGSAAFAALGIVIGLTTGAETSYATSMTALMFFSIIGGLWMPRDVLPGWLATVTTWTPSYQIADSTRRVVSGALSLTPTAGLVFAGWTAVFMALALLAFRRSARAVR